MKHVQHFTVRPRLPESLKPLLEIAYNLWWCWNPSATALFRRVENILWEKTHHNPVMLIGLLSKKRIEELLNDDVFLFNMKQVYQELTQYLNYETWYSKMHSEYLGGRIAYFSAEFGLHECFPIYSGGLGILAGDHLKSTSELGLPLVGVGLMYRYGYFRQYLNRDGWQQELYQENDFYNLPIKKQLDPAGNPIEIQIDFPGRKLSAQVWCCQVGRIPLYLLDTNLKSNAPPDRVITDQLYSGDLDMRIRQEILLGIGGIRALNQLNLLPSVCHMNEGHSAFMALERIRVLMREHGLSFSEAKEMVRASNIFTTHTPVPAGIDKFSPELFTRYFGQYCRELDISIDDLLALGRANRTDSHEALSMAILALNLASFANGVSELHGKVSRKMWRNLWPKLPDEEIPITHITNGVNTRFWLSDEFARLYDRYLGPRWLEDPVNQELWERIDNIPDAELWRSHERLRERLVSYVRNRLREQLKRRGVHHSRIIEAEEVLDPEALTIGFARRFATYKRANLFMSDKKRLAKIINNSERPVQFIFAGKAHPKDQPGKELIREIVHLADSTEFRRNIVFLEDYDIEVARYMVQGVDVWLNNPRRPLEASGTSGMKVPINGGINLSILDGWWCEAYNGRNGWAIGNGEVYDDHDYQDEVERRTLYEVLEKDVIPLFFQRNSDGLPRGWLAMMKASMRTVCPVFNTNRMVEEYTEKFYLPCLLQWNYLNSDKRKSLSKLVTWKKDIQQKWGQISIEAVKLEDPGDKEVGDDFSVQARVRIGTLSVDDISVEFVYGLLDSQGEIANGEVVHLHPVRNGASEIKTYTGKIPCLKSGRFGYSLRVLPYRRGLNQKFDMRLVKWW